MALTLLKEGVSVLFISYRAINQIFSRENAIETNGVFAVIHRRIEYVSSRSSNIVD
jgi:hypothetical protein